MEDRGRREVGAGTARPIVVHRNASGYADEMRVLSSVVALSLLLACRGVNDTADSSPSDSATHEVTAYQVYWSTDPDPIVAGQTAQFTETVTDQDGVPIGNLQLNHERMVHTIFVSADLDSFTHTHQEDYTPVTADNLRTATFTVPVTLPLSGRYFMMFDFASEDQWLQTTDDLMVTGSPAQASEPDLTPNDTVTVDGITATLTWSSAPVATYESVWTISLEDADGQPVTDVTQLLGADAHTIVVDSGTTWGSHTHAWFPDMASMRPSMPMPHLYDGPDIPFAFTFPTGGSYKMWMQFARSSEPGVVYTLPFVFFVAG